jgi:hypothetical protein
MLKVIHQRMQESWRSVILLSKFAHGLNDIYPRLDRSNSLEVNAVPMHLPPTPISGKPFDSSVPEALNLPV